MKYTEGALKEWRDSIEPAAPHGECLHFVTKGHWDMCGNPHDEGTYEKVKIINCCYDGKIIISFYDEPCLDYARKETLFPLDYLDDAE